MEDSTINNYLNTLKQKIKEYEKYEEDFPDKKWDFRLFTLELKILKKKYCKEHLSMDQKGE